MNELRLFVRMKNGFTTNPHKSKITKLTCVRWKEEKRGDKHNVIVKWWNSWLNSVFRIHFTVFHVKIVMLASVSLNHDGSYDYFFLFLYGYRMHIISSKPIWSAVNWIFQFALDKNAIRMKMEIVMRIELIKSHHTISALANYYLAI